MEFLLGVIVGAVAIFWLFFWLGTSERFKHLDQTAPPQHHNLYKTKPCQNHDWCEQHAKEGRYHCNKCGYAMEQ